MKLPTSIPNAVSASRAYQKTDFESKQPIVNSEGESLWLVPVMTNDGQRVERIDIQIYAASNPLEGVPPMTPLKVDGAYINTGTYNGRAYVKVWANRITKA